MAGCLFYSCSTHGLKLTVAQVNYGGVKPQLEHLQGQNVLYALEDLIDQGPETFTSKVPPMRPSTAAYRCEANG